MRLQGGVATDAAERRFESAKAASAQRVATSMVALDSMAVSVAPASIGTSASGPLSTQRVNGRTFVLRDGVWTDVRYRPNMPTTAIKPFSQAYFDLLDRLPELRAVFTIGGRVLVVGRDRAVSLTDSGGTQLTAAELKAIVSGW
jgi:hypothetical protein